MITNQVSEKTSAEMTENLTALAAARAAAAIRSSDRLRRAVIGQFATPEVIAKFMATMFTEHTGAARILDPGAGTGTLTAALVHKMLTQRTPPERILAHVYETDSAIIGVLEDTLNDCKITCARYGVPFESKIRETDFITDAAQMIHSESGLISFPFPEYTHCIMNPPYKKINTNSIYRKALRLVGLESANLYSAFFSLSLHLLDQNGEIVAIIPRSFCNGPYFRAFRSDLLKTSSVNAIHVFGSRTSAFGHDNVLQENVILKCTRHEVQGQVKITSSDGLDLSDMSERNVEYSDVVKQSDPSNTIHIAASDFDQYVVDYASSLGHTLDDLHIQVRTGPVVDFRCRESIHPMPKPGTVPLIYASHFAAGFVQWPNARSKKPNAMEDTQLNRKWLMPKGWYVLTRRFSAKEERRRIVAALVTPHSLDGERVAFENHLNVLHQFGYALEERLAKGLSIYLNSTLADLCFRQFSGHTQVNASDLRILQFPSRNVLINLSKLVGDTYPDQYTIDECIDREIKPMARGRSRGVSPARIRRRTQEALDVLKQIGMPKQQQNERSALTLLALLDLKPDKEWAEAGNRLIGITPIMDFIGKHFGKNYAPNTRETVRRQTVHQFVRAGVSTRNPDDPNRGTNSPKTAYQIEDMMLELVRSYGSSEWNERLERYLGVRQSLSERYEKRRDFTRIDVTIPGGNDVRLTPGDHSELIKLILEEFASRFTPGARVVYIGDTGAKMVAFDEGCFHALGLEFDTHGKFPDVVLYDESRNWLVVVEAVTSHGPIDSKRHEELAELFAKGSAGVVYVTAFPTRSLMSKYLSRISWETDVWVAEVSDHLIHFDGERFLGPAEAAGR